MSPIPDDELISAYLDDELSREDRLRAEQLLLDRADLRRLFDELRGLRQGLRSLPKFSLGDEFSSAVLRQAERSMLQRGDADNSKSPAAESAAAPIAPPTPPVVSQTVVSQTPQQQQAQDTRPVLLPDRSRALRPIVYVLTTVAAALAIMFYQQGFFGPRDVAMMSSPADKSGKEGLSKEAPMATHTVEGAAALRAKSDMATDGGGTLSSNSSVDRNLAPGSNALVSLKSANSRGAATADADVSTVYNVQNGVAIDKSGAAGAAPTTTAPSFMVPTPTVSLGAAQQVDALASNGTVAESVETVALDDYKRLQTLIFNSTKAQRADGTVDAVRLQEELASADAQQQQLQARDGRPAAAALADATKRKQTYDNQLQLQNRNSFSYGNGNGLVVVNITADRPTIEKVLPQVLGDNRVNDFSKVAEVAVGNSLGIAGNEPRQKAQAAGGYGQAATEMERVRESQRELASRASGADLGGVPPGEPDAKRAAGPVGRAGIPGQTGAIAGKAEGDRRELGTRAGEKGDAARNEVVKKLDAAEDEFEFVHIIANEDQLKAILKTLRSERNLFVDISAEGTPELYATNRWRELGLANQMADAKNQVAGGPLPSGAVNGTPAPTGTVNRPTADSRLAGIANRGGSAGDGLGQPSAPAAKAAGQPEPSPPTPVAAAKPTSTPSTAMPPSASVPTASPRTTSVATAPAIPALPLAAATAAKPKSAVPAANAFAGAAPGAAAPATPLPAAAPAVPAAPASTPAAGPSVDGLMTTSQPVARAAVDQPIAPSSLTQNKEQRYESQGYADQQRRAYSTQSRWQRLNTQQAFKQLFNEGQLEAGRTNHYAVRNPGAEKLQAGEGVAEKMKEPGKLNETAKKSDVAPAEGRGNGGKVADSVEKPLIADDRESKHVQVGQAGATPAPMNTAKSGVMPTNPTQSSTPKSDIAEAKPTDSTDPAARAAQLAKDESEARLRDSQSGGGGRGRNAPGEVAGGGFVPAPPMLPTQQPIAPAQQAAPEEVLGKIAQQPHPLVQQAMPTLAPNRIRGLAQEEQAASQNALQLSSELPADYQEALFVFRVVKSKDGAKAPSQAVQSQATQAPSTQPRGPASGEADSKQDAKPAKP